MTPVPDPSTPRGNAAVAWLRGLHEQVVSRVASLSWWRLGLLMLLLIVVGSILSKMLDLEHDVQRVATGARKPPVVVTLGGEEGVRVTKGGEVVHPPKPPAPPAPPEATPGAQGAPGAAGEPSLGEVVREATREVTREVAREVAREAAREAAREGAATPGAGAEGQPAEEPAKGKRRLIRIEDDGVQYDTQRVWTFRGLLGDLGATLMILLIAYLAAAKIVVRKVAQADAKVRTAEDAAGRAAMERQLVQAQLQVLQAQVEPHFLFNTLAAVDYLIETDPPRASQMQKKLITYLRSALPQMRQESSTLGRELRLVRSYLDLIKMRIEERLEVEVEVADFLESAEFPPMMLQSLVENAIKHGIEPKPEGGKVTVSAKIQRGVLWVEVRDTGVGVVDTERLEAPTSGTGIGLQNIRERLAMLYPGKGRLTLMSDDSSGTVVRIGVPYKDADETEPAVEPQGQGA